MPMLKVHDIPEFLQAARESFLPERAQGRSLALQYIFTGSAPGECYLLIEDGALTTGEGRHPAPGVTVRVDFVTWQRIVTYELDPLLAGQQGLFSVEGDVLALMESDQWFKR